MLSRNITFTLYLLLFSLLFTGCTELPFIRPDKPVEPEVVDPSKQAKNLMQQGNYAEAAQAYLQLAHRTPLPTRQSYQVFAIEAFLKANMISQAKTELRRLNTKQAIGLKLPLEFIYIHLAIAEGHTEDALARLNNLGNPNQLPAPYNITYLQRKADILESQGKVIEANRERIKITTLLKEPTDIRDNHQDIWHSLTKLPPSRLEQLPQIPNDIFSGWVALTLLKDTHVKRMQQAIAQWNVNYPNHPASKLAQTLAERAFRDPARKQFQIALLLPLKGRFKPKAEMIQHGFNAALYQNKQSNRPHVEIHHATTDNIIKIYQQAVDEGADLVVGPLEKDALEKLSKEYPRLPIPTLGLNYLDGNHRTPNLYQFGLSPEDEAMAVATKAWADGHRVAAILAPKTEWSNRIIHAFSQEWKKRGGKIGSTGTYDSKNFDTPVKQLRGRKIDAIFMLAFPQHAQMLYPFLKYHNLDNIPVYSTSHVYYQQLEPKAYKEVDGLMFTDMPWILSPDNHGKNHLVKLQQAWKEEADNLQNRRLYAMGLDAYALLGLLTKLGTTQMQWQGQTGKLVLANDGKIHRQQLNWAKFMNGKVQLLMNNAFLPVNNKTPVIPVVSSP